MRSRVVPSALIMVASALAVPMALTSSPAVADSCDHSVHHFVAKKSLTISARVNSEYSKWNPTPLTQDFSVQYGKTSTFSETKSWTAGGSAGFNWGIVSADVSGTYGEAATRGVTVSSSVTETVHVPSHYTGWFRVDAYRQLYSWRAVTERWDAGQARCVQHQLAGALWGDKKIQFVDVTKKGHQHPAKTESMGVVPVKR